MIPDGNGPFSIIKHPVHLGANASCLPQPEFTGDMSWYMGYGERHGSDGVQGRLFSMHSFEAPWDSWEMHPEGSELVLVTQGRLTLIQESDGAEIRIQLEAGQYAINPPGVWHTADAEVPVTAVFVTVGAGTEHRLR